MTDKKPARRPRKSQGATKGGASAPELHVETETKEKFDAYIGFRSVGPSKVRASVIVHPTFEKISKWKDDRIEYEKLKAEDKDYVPAKLEEADVPSDDDEENIMDVLSRARESLSAFHTMISASLILMPAVRAGYVNDDIYNYANKNFSVVEKDDRFEIFGLGADQLFKVGRQVRRLRELDRGMELMPPAILMSLVATFDTIISDLIRGLIRKNPARFDNSARTLSVKDILSMDSFDEVRAKILDDEIDSLMRGSHDDHIAYIEQNFNVKIKSSYDRWAEFIEIFERRNLAAHGNLTVNARYISNCKSAGLDTSGIEIGNVLELSSKYLKGTVDLLLEFTMLTVLVLWKKVSPQDARDATVVFSNEMYELIKDGRTAPAGRLLEFVLNKQNAVVEDSITKMMTINLAISYMKEGDKKSGIRVLDGTDWSSCSLDFKICDAALREKIDDVVAMMPVAASSELVSLADFKEWPAFDWIRKAPAFQDKLKELFGPEATSIPDQGPETSSLLDRLGDD